MFKKESYVPIHVRELASEFNWHFESFMTFSQEKIYFNVWRGVSYNRHNPGEYSGLYSVDVGSFSMDTLIDKTMNEFRIHDELIMLYYLGGINIFDMQGRLLSTIEINGNNSGIALGGKYLFNARIPGEVFDITTGKKLTSQFEFPGDPQFRRYFNKCYYVPPLLDQKGFIIYCNGTNMPFKAGIVCYNSWLE